jgi:hypothetical protein
MADSTIEIKVFYGRITAKVPQADGKGDEAVALQGGNG